MSQTTESQTTEQTSHTSAPLRVDEATFEWRLKNPLKKFRVTTKGHSRAQAAHVMNISMSTINNIEAGGQALTDLTTSAITRYMGIEEKTVRTMFTVWLKKRPK